MKLFGGEEKGSELLQSRLVIDQLSILIYFRPL